VPAHHDGGIRGITVDCHDPGTAAEVWGALTGVTPADTVLSLDDGRQRVAFRPAGGGGEAITELVVAIPGGGSQIELCGLMLRVVDSAAG